MGVRLKKMKSSDLKFDNKKKFLKNYYQQYRC